MFLSLSISSLFVLALSLSAPTLRARVALTASVVQHASATSRQSGRGELGVETEREGEGTLSGEAEGWKSVV